MKRNILQIFNIILKLFNTIGIFFKKIYGNIYSYFTNKFTHICKKQLEILYNTPIIIISIFYLFIFLIGRKIAEQDDFPWSLVHQINLSIISLICIYMLQYLNITLKKIRDELLGVNIQISNLINKLSINRLSALNLILPIFPVCSFICKIIKMKYVPISIVGIFAIFMSASTFYIALICYWQLLLSTYTIYKLSQINYYELPFSFPQDIIKPPKWISNLVDIFKKTQFSFFTVGILFTIEYILLIPSDVKILDESGQINASIPSEFWSTWIIIFLFVIVAFPVFWLILKNYLIVLVNNLNRKIIDEMLYLKPTAQVTDSTALWSYYQLMQTVAKYENKLFPKKNFYPLIATSLSFLLNLIKLFDLFKLPLFWNSI